MKSRDKMVRVIDLFIAGTIDGVDALHQLAKLMLDFMGA